MEQENGILFQIVTIGNSVKVTAVDEATGTEFSLVVPRNTPMLSLKLAAKRKLAYVMNKNKQSS